MNLHPPFHTRARPRFTPPWPPERQLRSWWLSRELGVLATVLFVTNHGSTMNSIVLSYIFVLIASVHINISLELKNSFVNMNQNHLYT